MISQGTAASYEFAKTLDDAQFVASTSTASRHSMHQELVLDRSYVETITWTAQFSSPTNASESHYSYVRSRDLLEHVYRLFQLSYKAQPRYIPVGSKEIAMFDRALMASSKLLYELPV